MTTGRLPFGGNTAVAISDAILHAPPRPFETAAAPERLKAAILRLLEKDPAKRFASAEDLRAELAAIEASMAPVGPGRISMATAGLLGVAALVVVALGAWFWHRASRARWAREVAAPEIARLVAAEEFTKAAVLSREARAVLPRDPALEKLWTQAT